MPKRNDIKKVLVIGSGPIIIGQAAEFDYAGTQACLALKDEGVEVVLVNSNPATIMTDRAVADAVYIEPITIETLEKIIIKEKPDSILPTLGGQNGLNMAMRLAESGFLEKYNVKTIGTSIDTIKKAEDRQEFKDVLEKIGQPCIASKVVTDLQDALHFAEEIDYPVVVRPAYTLGGTGGGIAYNQEQLKDIAKNGLRLSRVGQVLIEKCISGWKEIEYEVMRDSKGNCITVCNMENVDPVGVHTGDSIVVAPSQTLADKECQMLRSAALAIIEELKIEGGCNVQFALFPTSFEYAVIEVNPRVSRSSALASKATGYPIAKLTAKIALGYTLDEIKNDITGITYASFEPTLDYVVCKIPKWPFDKFIDANHELGTQMKATGEVMSIANNFEAALMKALRSLEQNIYYLHLDALEMLSDEEIVHTLKDVNDLRLFVIAEALRRNISIKDIREITKIDDWFIDRIKILVEIEEELRTKDLTKELLDQAKYVGFPDKVIAILTGKTEEEIYDLRKEYNIVPGYRMVDTCAAEFEATTPYFYSSYHSFNEVDTSTEKKKKIVVLGSGPIRIGQGIEFDYCCVHSVFSLNAQGYETIVINNNPETVSTDFDIADKLYFEPLTKEDVRSILEIEKPDGVIVQFGGQTAIKLVQDLVDMGVAILGTPASSIDKAEDRKLFDAILEENNIDRPRGTTVFTTEEALQAASNLGYPILIRPSYVLGGAGMRIAHDDSDVIQFMNEIAVEHKERPILIDQYLMGKEVEVDAICDGYDVLIPGIMEHVERAGVHSGDSISVYPPQKISLEIKEVIIENTKKLAKALDILGLINIQFIVYNDKVYVIEVNPRSSRTIPYLSKVTGVGMVDIATRCMMGATIPSLGYDYGMLKEKELIAIKMPVFSFDKIKGADIVLGPEMKSTGEVLGVDYTFEKAVYKAFLATGMRLPNTMAMVATLCDDDKEEGYEIIKKYVEYGYTIYATKGTYHFLKERKVKAILVDKIKESDNNIIHLISNGKIDLIINRPTRNKADSDGSLIRRFAVEHGVECFTSLDTANALIESLLLHHIDYEVIDMTKAV